VTVNVHQAAKFAELIIKLITIFNIPDTVGRSRNHFCSGKAIFMKYYVRDFVTFVILHDMAIFS